MAPNVSKVDTLEQKHTDYIRQLVDTRYDKNLDCAVTSWYRVYQSLQAAFPELTTTVYYVRKAGRDVLSLASDIFTTNPTQVPEDDDRVEWTSALDDELLGRIGKYCLDWDTIGAELGLDSHGCRARWQNLKGALGSRGGLGVVVVGGKEPVYTTDIPGFEIPNVFPATTVREALYSYGDHRSLYNELPRKKFVASVAPKILPADYTHKQLYRALEESRQDEAKNVAIRMMVASWLINVGHLDAPPETTEDGEPNDGEPLGERILYVRAADKSPVVTISPRGEVVFKEVLKKFEVFQVAVEESDVLEEGESEEEDSVALKSDSRVEDDDSDDAADEDFVLDDAEESASIPHKRSSLSHKAGKSASSSSGNKKAKKE